MAGLLVAAPAISAEDGADLETVRTRLQATERALDLAREEERSLTDRLVGLVDHVEALRAGSEDAARQVAAKEEAVAALERQAHELESRVERLSAALAARHNDAGRLLMTLQRVARVPPGALPLAADRPLDVIRAGILANALLADIAQQSAGLRDDLQEVVDSRAALRSHRLVIEAALADLDRELERLARLNREAAAARSDLAEALAASTGQVRTLGSDAAALADRVREVEASARHVAWAKTYFRAPSTRPAPPGPAPSPTTPHHARASAPPSGTGPVLPTDGRVIVAFGERDGAVTTSRGVTFAATPGTGIVAPEAGLVAFAGPFRGYGLLLILEHPDGYHSLLAGLESIDAAIGDRVAAGQTVGRMGHPDRGTPSLYFELRKQGRPVDPLPWLTAGQRKASG